MWSFNAPWPIPDPLNDAVHLDGPACTGDWHLIDEDPSVWGEQWSSMKVSNAATCRLWFWAQHRGHALASSQHNAQRYDLSGLRFWKMPEICVQAVHFSHHHGIQQINKFQCCGEKLRSLAGQRILWRVPVHLSHSTAERGEVRL